MPLIGQGAAMADKSFGKSVMRFGNGLVGCGCLLTLVAIVAIVLFGAVL